MVMQLVFEIVEDKLKVVKVKLRVYFNYSKNTDNDTINIIVSLLYLSQGYV